MLPWPHFSGALINYCYCDVFGADLQSLELTFERNCRLEGDVDVVLFLYLSNCHISMPNLDLIQEIQDICLAFQFLFTHMETVIHVYL